MWQRQVDDVVMALCTVPDVDIAQKVARGLVDGGLAACVNIVPGLRSIYRWRGEVCDDTELLLLVKTRRDKLEAVGQRVRELHPYENPEVIALGVEAGLVAYLDWVRQETADQGSGNS